MNWFRLYHGTSTNPKLAMIANKVGARPCEMTAFWLCLLEHASQQKPRGSVQGIDLEIIAFSQAIDAESLHRLYKGLEEKQVIVDGLIASWDEYQYAHDPTAAERKRRQREKAKHSTKNNNSSDDVTQGHNAVTQCHAPETEQTTEQESDSEKKIPSYEGTLPAQSRHKKYANKAPPPSHEFMRFWEQYPRTNCPRSEAWRSYQKASKRGIAHAALIDSLNEYHSFLEATGSPAAHPTTWLNQERWTVDYRAAIEQHRRVDKGASRSRTASSHDVRERAWREAIRETA